MSGERKRPTFHSPRSRATCVQPEKYWHCFGGNLGETAETRGGARMGLFRALRCNLELKLKLKTETETLLTSRQHSSVGVVRRCCQYCCFYCCEERGREFSPYMYMGQCHDRYPTPASSVTGSSVLISMNRSLVSLKPLLLYAGWEGRPSCPLRISADLSDAPEDG